MVINKVLEYIFNPPSVIPILRVLNERVAGVTGREAARLAGISTRAAQIALLNLIELKIVKRQVGGRDHIFTLNRDHYISENIIAALFEFERNLKNNIFEAVREKLSGDSVSVILYGSAARKTETLKSDLDICIITYEKTKVLRDNVSSLQKELNRKYSIFLSPFYISKSGFAYRAKRNKPPVNDIVKEGIVLCGKSIKQLLW